MGNESTDNKTEAAKTEIVDAEESGKSAKRKTFAGFLIESDIKPLVFIGKCVDYFGLGAVVGLLLGAAIVYGFALFKPLPYAAKLANVPDVQPTPTASTPPPIEAKMIRLHGFVRDRDNKPIAEPFTIAVLSSQYGPILPNDGSFSIQVPLSNVYSIAVWNLSASTVQVFNNYPAELDGDGYSLPSLRFFSSVSAGSTASLSTKVAGPELAESGRLNDAFNFRSLSSE